MSKMAPISLRLNVIKLNMKIFYMSMKSETQLSSTIRLENAQWCWYIDHNHGQDADLQ